jgi:tetratricopeptide (TPR) repeat protein
MSFELWSQWDDWRMTREVALHSGRRVDDRLMSASFGDDAGRLVPDVLMVKPGRENPWAATVAGLERALNTFQQLGEVGWHAMVILSLGNVYRAHSRLDLAGATLGECVELFREVGNREWEAAALFSQGSLRVVEGDLAGAVESYWACLAIFIDRRDALWQAYTRRALGYAYEQHGHYVDAVAELERALPVLREHGDQMWEAHTLLTVGRAKLGVGLTDEATGDLDACIDMFRRYGDPRSEAVALRCRAKASPGHLVETYLRDALAAFLRLENPVGVALTLCDLATLYRETDRSDEAQRYVRLARSLFAEQGMPGLAAAVGR